MGCSQTGNGHSIGRATDVVQSELMTELDGAWITPMFPANAEFDAGTGLTSALDRGLHQCPHPLTIENGKGIRIHNAGRSIEIDEFRRIIPGKSEGRLRQIVRAEREEFGLF